MLHAVDYIIKSSKCDVLVQHKGIRIMKPFTDNYYQK